MENHTGDFLRWVFSQKCFNLLRYFQVESMIQEAVQLKKEQVMIQFDTVYLSLKQCILYDSNNYTQI